MMDADILVDQVRQNPEQEALTLMALDAVMDEYNLSYDRATCLLWCEVEIFRRARELAEATHLMEPDSDSASYLRAVVVRFLGTRRFPNGHIILVEGNDPPRNRFRGHSLGVRRPARSYVTVGAGWMLRHWRERLAELERRSARDLTKYR